MNRAARICEKNITSKALTEKLKAALLGTVNKVVLAVSNLIFSKGYFLIY